MKKLLVATTLALSLPLFTSAATVAELQAQLAALMAQLSTLPSQTTPQSGAASCPNLTRNLSRGMKGSDVTSLQQFLVSQKHLATDSATGFFGALTEGAVKQWQAKNGVASSGTPNTTGYGVVGPKTRVALAKCIRSVSTPATTSSTSPTTASRIRQIPPRAQARTQRRIPIQPPRIQIRQQTPHPPHYRQSRARSSVGPTSRVVVMEYEAEFNPNFNPDYFAKSAYHPLLSSTNTSVGYDSSDPKILDQHYEWLKELGVDAVFAETTNNGPCVFGDKNPQAVATDVCYQYIHRVYPDLNLTTELMQRIIPTAFAMDAGTFNLYPEFSKRGAAIKIIPLIDGQDPEMFKPRSDGQLPIDVQVAEYYKYIQQYPEMAVIYQGKPLLASFMGPLSRGDTNMITKNMSALSHWQDRFIIRVMGALNDSQPSFWSNASGISGLHEMRGDLQEWSWIDRLVPAYGLLPSYTATGGRVEAFTVTSAAPSTLYPGNPLDSSKWADAWNGPDVMLYNGGVGLASFMSYAQALNPTFLIFNQFNEYGGPSDEGANAEQSNDIEPTKEWGYSKFNFAKQQILSYKNRTLSPAPVTRVMNRADSNDVLDGYPASNTIDLDHTSFYSSKQFATDQNDRNAALSVFVSNGPQTITRVMLRARMYQGVANGFPKLYTVYVTAAGGSGWVPVGDFSAQPDKYGVATVNLGGSYSTYAVLIIPKTLGTDANGNHFFQMTEVSVQ